MPSRIAAGDRHSRREASLIAASGTRHPRTQREVDTGSLIASPTPAGSCAAAGRSTIRSTPAPLKAGSLGRGDLLP